MGERVAGVTGSLAIVGGGCDEGELSRPMKRN